MERRDQAIAPLEAMIGTKCADLMRDQQQSLLAQLRNRARADVTDADGMALSPFDKQRWIKAFRIGMRPVMSDVYDAIGNLAINELGLELTFNVQDPNIIRAIERQVQSFAEEVNETTWNALRDSLAEGVQAGESIPKLEERVVEIMQDRIRSSGETIARTETTHASTTGTLETWRQSGVVKQKQWLAALDARTRETHVAAHGQIVGLDEYFQVGAAEGPGPGDLNDVSEVANCRCTVVAILDVEAPGGPLEGFGG